MLMLLFFYAIQAYSDQRLSSSKKRTKRKTLKVVYVALYFKTSEVIVSFFQGLVEVITSSDDSISVRATILLGELLHMVLY